LLTRQQVPFKELPIGIQGKTILAVEGNKTDIKSDNAPQHLIARHTLAEQKKQGALSSLPKTM